MSVPSYRRPADVLAEPAPESDVATLIALAAPSIVSMDVLQRIVPFNSSAEELFGYRAEDVVGQPMTFLLPGFTPWSAEGDGFAVPSRVRGRRRNGASFPAEVLLTCAKVDRRSYWTAVVRDCTRSDRTLSESRRRLQREREARTAAERTAMRAALLARACPMLDGLSEETTLGQVARLCVPELATLCLMDILNEDGSVHRVMARPPDRTGGGRISE